MAEIGQDILKAKSLLESGELVAIPTETVYGLAANALDPRAASQIFSVKNRPSFDPLIVHTDRVERISDFVKNIPKEFKLLLETFSPGPLTVLLERKPLVPDLITAGLPRVAVRIPKQSLTLDLLAKLAFPLAAPSANPFGYISPTSALHVDKQLGDKIPYILDGGPCTVGLESTIVGIENDEITVYRKGGLMIEAIEKIVGKVRIKDFSSSNPAAPGMLKSHYAPNKEIKLFKEDVKGSFRNKIGLLRFCETHKNVKEENQFILSANKNLSEAAQRLFAGLRYLDGLDIETIYLELVPDEGLGRAINDRLKRAAAVD